MFFGRLVYSRQDTHNTLPHLYPILASIATVQACHIMMYNLISSVIPIDPGVWPVSCGWPALDAGQLDERAAYTVPNATNRPLPWISRGESYDVCG